MSKMSSRWVLVEPARTQKSAPKAKTGARFVMRTAASRQGELEKQMASQIAKSKESAHERAEHLGAMRIGVERDEGRTVIFTDASGRETGRSTGRYGATGIEKTADEGQRVSYEDIVRAAPTEPFSKPSRHTGQRTSRLGKSRRR